MVLFVKYKTMVLQNRTQSTLDLLVKRNFNIQMRKIESLFVVVFAVFVVTSCQSSSSDSKNSGSSSMAKTFNNIIKSDKKKQSELDLPFRGFTIDKNIESFAFGSCADQDQPQPIWTTIEKNQPDLMIMLGDNVYASSGTQKNISEQYKKLKKIPEYRSIREKIPFMATWDDNDFGENDGGENNSEKAEAHLQFLKNWPYVKDLAPEKNGAIYHSKIFGTKKDTLQVIMLDTRTDRSDLRKNISQTEDEKKSDPKPYLPDDTPGKHFLSEAQWKWFEKELEKPAAFRIIASSIQVIANDQQFEKWGNFPKEKERFFNLLKKLKIKNALIISGDRHMASIAKKDIPGLGRIYDVTSSGLNKSVKPGSNLNDSTYVKEGYGQFNFGLVKIDWNNNQALVEIRSLTNEAVQSVTIKF